LLASCCKTALACENQLRRIYPWSRWCALSTRIIRRRFRKE